MTRPYLPRRSGDPLLASDFAELLARFDAELGAHDHSGGPLAPHLSGASFDPNTDATVQSVDAQRWLIAGQDLDELLRDPLLVSGGTITGNLAVSGRLEVGGRLILGQAAPKAMAVGQATSQRQEIKSVTVVDPLPEGSGKNHRAQGHFSELDKTALELDLPRAALLLIQFSCQYLGPCLHDPWDTANVPLSLPMFELIAQRDGRSVALGGDWDSSDWEGDPTDIDALLRSKAAERLWTERGVGGGFQTSGQPISGYVYAEGYLHLGRCVLARAGAGKLRLSAWAWGHGKFNESGLYATTLTELDDV